MIEIQSYKNEYRKEIIELIIQIQRDEFNIPITVDDQPDLSDISNFYQKGKSNFWVALNNGAVVGTIGLKEFSNHEGALRKMFVQQKFRGKLFGTASQLLQTLLEWARKQKVNTIYLGTREEFHAAQRFYKKNNFYEIPKSTLPVNFPLMKFDNKFYMYKSNLL